MSANKRLVSLYLSLVIVLNASITAYGDLLADESVNTDLDYLLPFEVVETTDDLYTTTADVVVVLSDDSMYGDGKGCVFQKMEAQKYGFPRADGSRMYPLPDQGALKAPDADYEQVMRIVKSYCGRDTLVYGQSNTLYSTNCENGIDCSAFVSAVFHNIDYSHSRYHLGTDQENIIGNHPIMLVEHLENIGWHRLVTCRMAQYFAEQKRLYSFINDTDQSAVEKLSFGDILFFSYDEESVPGISENYYNIGHVAIVLGTIPNDNCVIIAQGGGSPKKLTLLNNEKTAVKTSVLKITEEALKTQMKFFARPNYSGDLEDDVIAISNDSRSVFEPRFQINTRIDLNDGDLYLSTNSASTVDYYAAEPGAVLGHSGEKTFNGAEVEHYVAEYDSDYLFLRLSLVEDTIQLLDETRFLRFMCSISDPSVPFTLDFIDHLGCFSYQ